LDEFIVFDSLTQDDIVVIVDKFMAEVSDRIEDLKVSISLTSSARDWLAKTGFDRMYGARPLKRAIQRYVESPLSKRLLTGEFPEGSHIEVGVSEGEITFSAGNAENVDTKVANEPVKEDSTRQTVAK